MVYVDQVINRFLFKDFVVVGYWSTVRGTETTLSYGLGQISDKPIDRINRDFTITP